MLPDHADVIDTRAEVLFGSSKEDAIAFVDQYLTRVENPAPLLVVKGDALYHRSDRGKDSDVFAACLKVFAEAQRADPGNANAYFRPADYLASVHRNEEAYPLYRKALQLAPTDVEVRRRFWRMIQRRRDKTLKEADRETRKQQVLSSRIEVPEPAIAFDLQTLEERRVSLASLKGKVVAINFWGIWCGWCVKEMPDFQKLYEHYKDDPKVAILTINNDRNPESVPPWMHEKGYDFPVLLDDGYVDEADVNAFPTTWFLNRERQIAFEKRGWTKELEEEFGWRIEALK